MPAGLGPIEELKAGQAQEKRALTGCTALLAERGAVAAEPVASSYARRKAIGDDTSPLQPHTGSGSLCHTLPG